MVTTYNLLHLKLINFRVNINEQLCNSFAAEIKPLATSHLSFATHLIVSEWYLFHSTALQLSAEFQASNLFLLSKDTC